MTSRSIEDGKFSASWLIKRLTGIEKHIHDHLYTRKEVIALFERAGFRDVSASYFLFTTRRLPDLVLPLFRILDPILESIPGIKALAGIVIVRASK